jgi:BirA family biotin operon repressor/biotin-[acetyl-CoA-carboxylase] ligase
MNGEASRIRHAVIGIGINVNQEQFPANLRSQATSLRLEAGREIAREELLIGILRRLSEEVDGLVQTESFTAACAEILRRLEAKSTWIRGKHVFVDEAEGYTGLTAGLDEKGFLLVRTDDGLRRVLSGGVRERLTKG